MNYRKRIYETMEVATEEDRLSRSFDVFILLLITSNIIAMILESVGNIQRALSGFFEWFEILSVAVFSIEYTVRLWSCVEKIEYRKSITGRIRFALTPLLLVDLLAILPFYLPFVGIDLRFLRSLRLMRVSRMAKFARYSKSLQVLKNVLVAKKGELTGAFVILFILLIIASSSMYFAEKEVQPEQFSSIPASMWWAIATLTTVGYGDICPVTGLGKFMGAIISVLGIGMFALPTGILGAGFVEHMEKARKDKLNCPHCGKTI